MKKVTTKSDVGKYIYIIEDNVIKTKMVEKIIMSRTYNVYYEIINDIQYLCGNKWYKEDSVFVSEEEILKYLQCNITE